MYETKVAWISMLDEDTLRIEFKPDAFVDIEDLSENLEAYKKLMRKEKVFLLSIAGSGVDVSPEVRKMWAEPERSSFKIAEAFVITSLAQKIIANYVMRVQRPDHPIKFFTSEKDAVKWLTEQKTKFSNPEEVF